jgi:putative ABC transport system permease protein
MMHSTASLQEAFRIALASLRASKLRSFLTLLGIILSTTTLIAVMAIIHGMDVYVAEKIADLGADNFVIVRMAFFGDFEPKKFLELLRKNPELSIEEFEFIRKEARLIRDIGMRTERTGPLASGNDRMEDVEIVGCTPNMGLLLNKQAVAGRYLTESDNNSRRAVAFIGADVKDQFFPSTDPIGKTILIDSRPFEVVGVSKRAGSVFGQSQDNYVEIPVNSYFKNYGSRRGISFIAQAIDHAHFEQAMDEAKVLIRSFRHLPPAREDNFTVFTSASIMGAWDKLTGAIAATAVAVVSVFMVVGGVVIMNIMLAVVTERTSEIGIRKSLGARRKDILQQFLVESATLASCGGLLGVIIAWVIAVVVRNVTPVPMELPLSSVVVGVGLSATVGMFFGIYPAQKAARLDPIEALRAEK